MIEDRERHVHPHQLRQERASQRAAGVHGHASTRQADDPEQERRERHRPREGDEQLLPRIVGHALELCDSTDGEQRDVPRSEPKRRAVSACPSSWSTTIPNTLRMKAAPPSAAATSYPDAK
jgi:hypothetical protein